MVKPFQLPKQAKLSKHRSVSIVQGAAQIPAQRMQTRKVKLGRLRKLDGRTATVKASESLQNSSDTGFCDGVGK